MFFEPPPEVLVTFPQRSGHASITSSLVHLPRAVIYHVFAN